MALEAAALFSPDLVQETTQLAAPHGATEAFSAHHLPSILECSSDDVTDEQLLVRVGLGSHEALSFLFRRHGRVVLHTACRILRDESEADDLRQDVFLYVFQKANQFDSTKGSAISWLIQITYHRAIDRRRYLTSRQHYNSEELVEESLLSSDGLPSIDAIDGSVILKRLRGELSEDQKQTLELHFFEGYSLREIAEECGQTVGSVRHHYYRALERLRSSLFPEKRIEE